MYHIGIYQAYGCNRGTAGKQCTRLLRISPRTFLRRYFFVAREKTRTTMCLRCSPRFSEKQRKHTHIDDHTPACCFTSAVQTHKRTRAHEHTRTDRYTQLHRAFQSPTRVLGAAYAPHALPEMISPTPGRRRAHVETAVLGAFLAALRIAATAAAAAAAAADFEGRANLEGRSLTGVCMELTPSK